MPLRSGCPVRKINECLLSVNSTASLISGSRVGKRRTAYAKRFNFIPNSILGWHLSVARSIQSRKRRTRHAVPVRLSMLWPLASKLVSMMALVSRCFKLRLQAACGGDEP